MVVCAEDAVTPLGSSLVTLTAGKAYSLVLKSGKSSLHITHPEWPCARSTLF